MCVWVSKGERKRENKKRGYALNGLRQTIVDGTIFTLLSLRGSVNELICHPLVAVLIRNTKYCEHMHDYTTSSNIFTE